MTIEERVAEAAIEFTDAQAEAVDHVEQALKGALAQLRNTIANNNQRRDQYLAQHNQRIFDLKTEETALISYILSQGWTLDDVEE